jgi:glycosyltransferase involved in cell wall biosynthesis
MGTLGRYPYVLHCHGSDVRSGLYHPLRKHLVTYSLKRAEMVLLSTPDLYQHVKPIREDAIFLPNPIDTTVFSPGAQGTETTIRILINMSLKKSKAPEIAFEAAEQIQKMFADIEVYAFASGPEFNHFRQYGGVNFMDPIPHENMPNLVNSFDIILGQFSIGSLGMSELESMACGKPVICHVDKALYNQWYRDLPPVFTAQDGFDVIELLTDLIESRERRIEVGKAAREWVLKYHDYLSVARRLTNLYKKMDQ